MPACAHRPERRLLRQVGRRDAGVDDVAFADAGTLQDPLVGGLDQLLEVGVGQHARRNIGRQTRDLDAAQHA